MGNTFARASAFLDAGSRSTPTLRMVRRRTPAGYASTAAATSNADSKARLLILAEQPRFALPAAGRQPRQLRVVRARTRCAPHAHPLRPRAASLQRCGALGRRLAHDFA